jgi:hypothetical protein
VKFLFSLILIFVNISINFEAFAQFIPEQKDFQDSPIQKTNNNNLLIPTFLLLSMPYEVVSNTKEFCSNLVRYGAPQPSSNYLNLINNIYPKVLNEIKFCHYKSFGRNITRKDIDDYKFANPDSAMNGIDVLNNLIQHGGLNLVPKTRADLQRCSLLEPLLMNHLKTFETLTSYPDKNWCEKVVKGN